MNKIQNNKFIIAGETEIRALDNLFACFPANDENEDPSKRSRKKGKKGAINIAITLNGNANCQQILVNSNRSNQSPASSESGSSDSD